jgi:hypothetical protein
MSLFFKKLNRLLELPQIVYLNPQRFLLIYGLFLPQLFSNPDRTVSVTFKIAFANNVRFVQRLRQRTRKGRY